MQMFCKVEISKGIEKTIGRTIAISKGSERLRIGLVDNSLRQTARMKGIGCALIDRGLEWFLKDLIPLEIEIFHGVIDGPSNGQLIGRISV